MHLSQTSNSCTWWFNHNSVPLVALGRATTRIKAAAWSCILLDVYSASALYRKVDLLGWTHVDELKGWTCRRSQFLYEHSKAHAVEGELIGAIDTTLFDQIWNHTWMPWKNKTLISTPCLSSVTRKCRNDARRIYSHSQISNIKLNRSSCVRTRKMLGVWGIYDGLASTSQLRGEVSMYSYPWVINQWV